MNDELMQNVLKQLSKQERIILADMWESDIRPVLTKLLGQRQLQIAQMTLQSSADHYFTVEQRGRANEMRNLTKLLSANLKNVNNERNAKNKAE
jgi:hypothetical protein